MAKEVASLYATVSANTKPLQQGLKGAKTQLGDAARATGDMLAKVGMLTAGLTALGIAAKKGYEFAKHGAELERTREKFDRLAKAIGTTGTALRQDLRTATRGLMSDAEMMASASDMMALGLAKTQEQAIRLTRVAAALNMEIGELVLALTNQTTRRFDQLGVSVTGFDKRLRDLKSTGMSVEDAFTEAFLQQAEDQITKVGDVADSAVGSFIQLETAVKNLGDSLSQMESIKINDSILGWLVKAIDATTKYNDAMNALEQALAQGVITDYELLAQQTKMQLTSYDAADAMEWLNVKIEEHRQAFLAANPEVAKWLNTYKTNLPAIIPQVADFSAQLERLQQVTSAGGISDMTAEFAESMSELQAEAGQLAADMAYLNSLPTLTPEQQEGLNQLQGEYGETQAAIEQLVAKHQEAMYRMIYDMAVMRANVDGNITQSEYDLLESIGRAMGIFDEATWNAIQQVDAAFAALASGGGIQAAQAAIMNLGNAALAISGDYYIVYHVSYVEDPHLSSRDQTSKGSPGSNTYHISPTGSGYTPSDWAQGLGGGGGGGGGSGLGDYEAPTMPAPPPWKAPLAVASAMSSLASIAANQYEDSIVSPLQDAVDAADEEIAKQKELISLLTAMPQDIGVENALIEAQEKLAELEEDRAKAAEELAKQQEKILHLQEQQQNLDFLQAQFRLLETIQENGLNAADILGGLELGLDADMGAILDAMSAAMQELIEQAENELGIASPSKVFKGIGQNIVKGLVQGMDAPTTFDAAVQDLFGAVNVAGIAPSLIAPGGNSISVSLPLQSIDSLIDIERLAYRVASVIQRHQ